MKTLFLNANAVLPNKTELRNILCENGLIIDVDCNKNQPCDQVVDLKGDYLLAGFVDIHIHGGGGADFMDGDIESMEIATNTHLQHGTTTIFPTTMSARWEDVKNTVNV